MSRVRNRARGRGYSGGGGAAAAATTYTRTALDTADGDHLEAAVLNVPASGALLFYGDVQAVGATEGTFVCATGSAGNGSVVLRAAPATTVSFTFRRNSGAGEAATYAIADATTYGPRLYYATWDAGFAESRCGVDDMVVDATYGTNANLPKVATSIEPASFLARAASTGFTDRNATANNCWALCISRVLTTPEWALAAAGDYSWAVGDGDLDFIFAPNSGAPGDAVDGSQNISTGGPYTVANNGSGSPDVPMTVSA